MCTSGKTEKKVRRPFHETIVDQIREETTFSDDLAWLGRLIMATKIPKNHDAIIVAWQTRCLELVDEEIDFFFINVLNDLREQKKEAEAEAKVREESLREWSNAT
jgi:hypothetical protein